MVLFGIAVVAAGLMGVWHVTKYAAPRALRAVGKRRRASIDRWRAENPQAPAVARWAAAFARWCAAVRWGPRHLVDEVRQAWDEGLELGKQKYGVVKTDEPHPDEPVVEPEPEPAAEPPSSFNPPVRPRPYLVPVPNPSGHEAGSSKENTTMTIQTATGGEIANAEQFHAEAKAIEQEAAADMEDAAADSKRAEEDQARIERMVASLTGVQALASDISAVAALKEPAAARAAAAKARLAAADQRLAGAKQVSAIAAKHVQLIGTAAGGFYKAA